MRPSAKGWATVATAAPTEHSSTSTSGARPGSAPSAPSRALSARRARTRSSAPAGLLPSVPRDRVPPGPPGVRRNVLRRPGPKPGAPEPGDVTHHVAPAVSTGVSCRW
ncbi:hypothetical protein GCM10023238_03640 [Streptomyces heliomycini]